MWPSPKTIFENNQTIVSCFRKRKDFLKIPFLCKLASKRYFITSQRDWAFDEQGWASPKPHLETIKHYLRENKTKLFSEIVFHWHRERFFRLRNAINIWSSLGEHMYDIQNWWTFIEQFWRQNYFLKRLFLLNSLWKRWFKFSLIHVKFAMNVLPSPKTTFENK